MSRSRTSPSTGLHLGQTWSTIANFVLLVALIGSLESAGTVAAVVLEPFTVPAPAFSPQETSGDVEGASDKSAGVTSPSIADFAMPPSAVVYLELNDPAFVIDWALANPLTQKGLELEDVQRGLKSPEMAAIKILVGTLEEQLQLRWSQILETTFKHGIAVSFDASTQGVILVSRSSSGESLREIVKAILGWVNLEAKLNRKAKPYEAQDYRGHRILKFEEFLIARVDDWFLVGNRLPLIKQSMDRLIENRPGDGSGLAGRAEYQLARQMKPAEGIAWGYVDLDRIRQAGLAKPLFEGTEDNAFLEFLFGGVLENLRQADYLAANLQLSATAANLEFTLPRAGFVGEKHRAYFFAKEPVEKSSFLINVNNQVARLIMRRDLGAWWLNKENLFNENVIAQMALADSQFTTILAGMNFGEDFLSAFEPNLQLIVAADENRQTQSAIKLPTLALVGQLKNPELKRRLRITFNSVIGFVNIQGGMDGMPPMEVITEIQDGLEVTAASYLEEGGMANTRAPLDISPTIAFVDDYMILATTRELAVNVAREGLQKTAKSIPIDRTINLLTEIDAPLLMRVIEDNREYLVAQQMLEKGFNQQEASLEVAQLMELLRLFEKSKLMLEVHPDAMKLSLQVDLKE